MELANPKVRTLFTSYDVIGRRHTLIVAYTSARWRQASPKLYQTTFDGPSDAIIMIRRDPRATAELFLRQEPSKLDQEAICVLISDEYMLYFTLVPTGVMAFSDHMTRTGQMRHELTSWKDAFFANVHDMPGN